MRIAADTFCRGSEMHTRYGPYKSNIGLEPHDRAGILARSTTVIAARYWVSADAGHLTVAIDALFRRMADFGGGSL